MLVCKGSYNRIDGVRQLAVSPLPDETRETVEKIGDRIEQLLGSVIRKAFDAQALEAHAKGTLTAWLEDGKRW
jgi:hypothetical protein